MNFCVRMGVLCVQHADLKQEMVIIVPSDLWSKHETDVGIIKSAQPTTKRMLEAGVLVAEPNPCSNTFCPH